MRKTIFSFILLTFLIGSFLGAAVAGQVIHFKDKEFERCVRQTLGLKPGEPVTVEMAKRVEKLECNIVNGFDRIQDISGIEFFINLKELDLRGTEVTDLTPLKNLTNLEKLKLRGTKVTNIGPLKKLIKLKVLDLGVTEVSDLTPLRNLTGLERLDLEKTKVTSINPLQHLTNLEVLNLSETGVTDLTPLKNLINLKELYLWWTRVTDLSPLKNLTNLEVLMLGDTGVTDLTPLKNLTNLEKLYLEGTLVTDISPVAHLPKLKIYGWTPPTPPFFKLLKPHFPTSYSCSVNYTNAVVTEDCGAFVLKWSGNNYRSLVIEGSFKNSLNAQIAFLAQRKGLPVAPGFDMASPLIRFLVEKAPDSLFAGWGFMKKDTSEEKRYVGKVIVITQALVNAVNAGDLKTINTVIEAFLKEKYGR